MKRFTITIISAMLCGLVVLSACGGAKKNVQDAEGQAEAGGNAPGGYLMPAISANNFCGDFTTMTPDCENSAYVATEKVAGNITISVVMRKPVISSKICLRTNVVWSSKT